MSKQVGMEQFIKFDSNGNIDHQGSVGAFASALLKYEAEREVEEANIADAFHAVFDEYPDKPIMVKGFVVNSALMKLNVQAENFPALTKKVSAFLSTSPQFKVDPGKGGGCRRV